MEKWNKFLYSCFVSWKILISGIEEFGFRCVKCPKLCQRCSDMVNLSRNLTFEFKASLCPHAVLFVKISSCPEDEINQVSLFCGAGWKEFFTSCCLSLALPEAACLWTRSKSISFHCSSSTWNDFKQKMFLWYSDKNNWVLLTVTFILLLSLAQWH